MSRALSPTDARAHALEEFSREYRPTCGCPRLELREEANGLECARCGEPILKRVVFVERRPA
jgi:hypothetical protein